jgi:hypothetical protein
MRIVIPERLNSSLSNTRTCSEQSCGLATREGKPYCPEHVAMNPYSKRVVDEIARREAEDDKIRQGATNPRDVNICGITAQEIIQNLTDHGPRTLQRLCRELTVEEKILWSYVEALRRRGFVVIGRTSRGSLTVSLRK